MLVHMYGIQLQFFFNYQYGLKKLIVIYWRVLGHYNEMSACRN